MELKAFPTDHHEADVAARVIFFIDAGIKLFAFVLCLIAPGFLLKVLIPAAKRRNTVTDVGDYKVSETPVQEIWGITPVATGIARWFGVALAALAYMELRSLITFENVALGFVLEGLALADILHVFAALQFRRAAGGWSFANFLGFLWVLIALGWRIYYLVMHYKYDLRGTMKKWYPDTTP